MIDYCEVVPADTSPRYNKEFDSEPVEIQSEISKTKYDLGSVYWADDMPYNPSVSNSKDSGGDLESFVQD